jgi:flagellar FliL protein
MSDAKKKDDSKDDSKDGEEGAKPKAGKKKLFIIIGAVVALLGGGGGAAWFFLGRGHHDEQADAAAAAKAEEKLKAARSFVTLDPFIVNLADTDLDRYTQIGVVLEVENAEANKKVADRMPAIRNGVLLLISSKTASDLTSREGKEKLAKEIALSAGKDLGWTPPDPNAHGDDGDEEPDSKAKEKKSDDKPSKESDKKAKPAKHKAEPPSNPITAVHFASFIVQ